MRKYCDCEKIDIEILTDLHGFNPHDYENVVFEILPDTSYVPYYCLSGDGFSLFGTEAS
jgi:hypothetical protein